MKEVQTPLDPKELDRRLIQFQSAVKILAAARDALGSGADLVVKRQGKEIGRVDEDVLKLMTGAINKVYHDLVGAGFKGFADNILEQNAQPRFSPQAQSK